MEETSIRRFCNETVLMRLIRQLKTTKHTMVLQRNSTNETDRLINNKKTLPRLKKEEQDAKHAFHTSIIVFCLKKNYILFTK